MPEIVDVAGARAAFVAAGGQLRAHGVNWIAVHGGEHLLFEDVESVLVAARLVTSRPDISADDLIAALDAPPPESPLAWTAVCASCGQSFISDTPVGDGAVCPTCTGVNAMTTALTTQQNYIPAPPTSAQAQLANSIPLYDLTIALETHAKQLPKPLPTDYYIPIPAGLPERLSVPIGFIETGRYQPRKKFDQEKIAELASSIAEHGILNPMIVFANERGNLELIGGERRLRAGSLANLMMVPVEVRSYTLRQIDEISTIDNLQREDLAPVDEGFAYERMITTWGISETELAKRLGKNRAYIQQRRAIATAAPEVLAALDADTITFSVARAIAQAAPGETKIQQRALKAIHDQQAKGGTVKERDAQRITEETATKVIEKALKALNWSISKTQWGIYVWSDAERPRTWSGAELLRAAHEKLRPGGLVPAARAITKSEQELFGIFTYYQYKDYMPWLFLHGMSGAPVILAPEEVPAFCADLQAQYGAMLARYQAAGWVLSHDSSSGNQFTAKSAKGRVERPWRWDGVETTIKGIEAGTIHPEPPAKVASPAPQKVTCERCGTKVSDWHWSGNDKYCTPCTNRVKQEAQAREQRIAADVRRILHPALQALPMDALRILAAALPSRATYGADRKKSAELIQQADAATLARRIAVWAIDPAVRDYACPVYTQLPGSDPAPIEPPVDTSPLAAIRAGIAQLETWQERTPDGETEEGWFDEVRMALVDATAIRADLVALADAPDVATDDYERLSRQLGMIEDVLRTELAESENV